MQVFVSPNILSKSIDKHNVSVQDIEEQFFNHPGTVYLEEDRASNRALNPTLWFYIPG